jgi:CRISPR/Cas system-associated exonuclease Cas4 (RecB family)
MHAMAARAGRLAVEVVVTRGRTMNMIEVAWAMMILAVAIGFVGWVIAGRRAAAAERRQRPARLRDAELVFVERQFRSSGRWPVVARVDRVYRKPSGILVLVELKTRASPVVTRSDVIQLSAQRMAMEDELHATVADEAYVLIPRGHRGTSLIPLPVNLMAREEVEDLMRRRDALLRGLVEPRWPASQRTCRACGFRDRCGRAP